MIDLLRPVVLKGRCFGYNEYCQMARSEQNSAIEILNNTDPIWHVPTSLTDKVGPSGDLRPFFGDTIVLPLFSADIEQLALYQGILERDCDFLAETLNTQLFHMTIHDLSNGPELHLIENNMADNSKLCQRVLMELGEYFAKYPHLSRIEMQATTIFPCLNIALLLGLLPVTEKDSRVLMNLYNLFDEVVRLDYLPRFHITLDYFLPTLPNTAQLRNLYSILSAINPPGLIFSFDLREIVYQRFFDMNHYKTIVTA